MGERFAVRAAELRYVRRDPGQGALVLAGVVVPPRHQCLDAVFVGVDADRCVRPAPGADQAFEMAQPRQLAHQGAQVGVANTEFGQGAEGGLGSVEVACLQFRQPGRHMGLQRGFGGQRPQVDVVGTLFKQPVRQHRGLRVVAAPHRVLQLALVGAPERGRQREPAQHGHQRGRLPPTPARPLGLIAGDERREFRQQQQHPPARPALGGGLFFRRGRRGSGGGCDRATWRLGVASRLVDAKDVEERGWGDDEGRLVRRGGWRGLWRGRRAGLGRCVGRRGRGCVRGRWRGARARRRWLGLGFLRNAHSIGEVIAAECDQHAVLQRHRVLLQAQAIDEGAVGAGEVFDADVAAFLEHVRLPARQITHLPGMRRLVAGEQGIGLAHQERKARDDDGVQARVGRLGRQREREATRRPHLLGARGDLHAVRQHAAEGNLVAVLQLLRRLLDRDAVDRRAVSAAQVGQVDGTVFAEDPGVPARQHRQHVLPVVCKRRLVAPHGEHAVDDADLAQFGLRQRLQDHVNIVINGLMGWSRLRTSPRVLAHGVGRPLVGGVHVGGVHVTDARWQPRQGPSRHRAPCTA